MTFKVEKLEKNVHIVRVYYSEDDIKYFFICTLHKKKRTWRNFWFVFSKNPWHILGAKSSGAGVKTTLRVLRYLKNYPSGVYTYVSSDDWERFYKRFCKKIYFDNCDF